MAVSGLDSAFNTIILYLESKKDCLDDSNSRKKSAVVVLESGWGVCVFLAGQGGSAEG